MLSKIKQLIEAKVIVKGESKEKLSAKEMQLYKALIVVADANKKYLSDSGDKMFHEMATKAFASGQIDEELDA